MTSEASAAEQPELVLRGGGVAARFDGDDVRLSEGHVRRRVPVAAIEEVRAAGPQGSTAEIVLTTAAGPATVYSVRHHNSRAVTVFAAAVNAALPPRDADEPRQDGEALVEVTSTRARPADDAKPAGESSPGDAAVGVAGLLLALGWLAGLVWLLVDGQGALRWGLGILPALFGLGALTGFLTELDKGLVLRRRGITVIAAFDRSEEAADSESPSVTVYRYTDLKGVVRDYRGSGRKVEGDAKRVEITYDPDHPEVVSGTGWYARLAGVTVLGLLTLALFAGALYLTVGSVVDVF
ncbi:hypothetical protein ACIP98_33730 [Streptomyces sp. NPDC088354]|uniref:hypothetical protein n=1 Tax=unclassified Streptomyces TaxID=2593676 RepID=UPI0029B42590|nr:hypothetical protein [Streptomyces sp. MI02-7b]MDX3078185.1 hypothetical protein [Streptomyces sp. MI02-7b]